MTRIERILDASVVAAAVYQEVFTAQARARLAVESYFIAPDLIFPELTHVGVKKMRRGAASAEFAQFALKRASELLVEIEPARQFASRAVSLASQYAISGYDAFYVALAEARRTPLLTADLKLAAKLHQAGWTDLVEVIGTSP